MTPQTAQDAVTELNRLTDMYALLRCHIVVEGKDRDRIALTQMAQNGIFRFFNNDGGLSRLSEAFLEHGRPARTIE